MRFPDRATIGHRPAGGRCAGWSICWRVSISSPTPRQRHWSIKSAARCGSLARRPSAGLFTFSERAINSRTGITGVLRPPAQARQPPTQSQPAPMKRPNARPGR